MIFGDGGLGFVWNESASGDAWAITVTSNDPSPGGRTPQSNPYPTPFDRLLTVAVLIEEDRGADLGRSGGG